MSVRPRLLLGLEPVKIRESETANLILVDLNRKWTVEPEKLHSKSCNTAFRNMELTGKVMMTITDGLIRYENQA